MLVGLFVCLFVCLFVFTHVDPLTHEHTLSLVQSCFAFECPYVGWTGFIQARGSLGKTAPTQLTEEDDAD